MPVVVYGEERRWVEVGGGRRCLWTTRNFPHLRTYPLTTPHPTMTLRPLLGGLQGLRAAGTRSCVGLLSARALSSYSRRPLRPSPSLNHSSSRPFPSSFPTSMRSSPVGLGPRSFFTEAITGLQELVGSTPLPGLVAASPLPLWATILALALTVRGCITFPMQLWQRRRVWRTRKFVVPEMKRVNQELAVLLAKESRRDGLTYKEYLKRLKAAVSSALEMGNGSVGEVNCRRSAGEREEG